jgi:membrane protease YdiL (CAAX protease family)
MWCKKFIYKLTASNRYSIRNWKYYRLPTLLLLLDFFITFILLGFFIFIEVPLSESESEGIAIFSWSFFGFILLVSVIEEFLFRIMPLSLIMRLTKRRDVVLLTALICSALFGYVHGGLPHILLQGIGGFLYAVLFIKYSRQGSRVVEGSIVVIAVHSLFNLLISLLLFLEGESEI